MRKKQGFTLIELMIVIAVIGIMGGIAYPSYQESVSKSRRKDAQGALVGLANAMERYFTERNTYVGTRNSDNQPTIYPIKSPVDGTTAYYNLFITSVDATTYTLQATRTGAQANDKCGNFTLSQTGARGISNQATGLTVADCW